MNVDRLFKAVERLNDVGDEVCFAIRSMNPNGTFVVRACLGGRSVDYVNVGGVEEFLSCNDEELDEIMAGRFQSQAKCDIADGTKEVYNVGVAQ